MGEERAVTVIKNNCKGEEVWRYEATVLARTDTCVWLEAPFNLDEVVTDYVTLRKDDRFVEHYYSDRWYSIFEIHAVEDDHLKGWYCNFSRPARLGEDRIAADDLELDLWISPEGVTLVLDQEDFDANVHDPAEREAVLKALEELQGRAAAGLPPAEDC